MTGSITHHLYCIAIAAPPSAKPASPIQAVIHAVTDITSIKLHASAAQLGARPAVVQVAVFLASQDIIPKQVAPVHPAMLLAALPASK